MTFAHAGIVGAGSFGTALGLLLHGNGLSVTLRGHNPEHVRALGSARENALYLPGVPLPESFGFTAEFADLESCDLVLIATPSKAIREVATALAATALRPDAVILSCTKGVERGTGLRMSEVLATALPRHPIAVLSGPSHAEEVARGMPTAVVLGCANEAIATALQGVFTTKHFRAYTSSDVAGIELGGALKNIFAIAAGVSDGLGLGDNSKAALVTRSLAELIRLGSALGGRPETFQGLSGIGDLIVTCFSQHSRNRRVGERLGRGESLAEISASMTMIAEGVPTTYSACECARRLGIDVPIIEQIRALLDAENTPREVLANLLARDPRAES